MDKKQITDFLNKLANALNQQAFQHKVQGRIFAGQGFNKLAEQYAAHAAEESEWVEKMIDRLIDLGVTPTIEPTQAFATCTDVEAYLKAELEVSEKGLAELKPMLPGLVADPITFDLMKDYLKDEEEDASHTAQQLDLIACIGLQNWLVQQL